MKEIKEKHVVRVVLHDGSVNGYSIDGVGKSKHEAVTDCISGLTQVMDHFISIGNAVLIPYHIAREQMPDCIPDGCGLVVWKRVNAAVGDKVIDWRFCAVPVGIHIINTMDVQVSADVPIEIVISYARTFRHYELPKGSKEYLLTKRRYVRRTTLMYD